MRPKPGLIAPFYTKKGEKIIEETFMNIKTLKSIYLGDQ